MRVADRGWPTENDMLPRVKRRVSCRRMSVELMGRVVMAVVFDMALLISVYMVDVSK